MFTIRKNDEPFLMRRAVNPNNSESPCSELLVTTFSGVAYAIPETLVAHPSTCAECDTRLKKPQTCSRCFTVSYCDKECQKTHWKRVHSQVCKLVDRSDVQDVLTVSRALSHESSQNIQFLRALNELERLSSTLGYTAHFLVTGEAFIDTETTCIKLTKAMTVLFANQEIERQLETEDFVVWWSVNPNGLISNVSICIESSRPYSICKVYKPYSIKCENTQEFRTKNRLDKCAYDEFKKVYKKGLSAEKNNMFFRDMQVMFAIESLIEALFGTIQKKDVEMHIHLYKLLIDLCKQDDKTPRMCTLLVIARLLIQEVDKKEQKKLKNLRSAGKEELATFPIPSQVLFDRLGISQDLSNHSAMVLFKYLYKTWVLGE